MQYLEQMFVVYIFFLPTKNITNEPATTKLNNKGSIHGFL